MPVFFFELSGPDRARPDDTGLPCPTLEDAYLELIETLWNDASEILARRQNPFLFTYLIRDEAGQVLMEVPFTDLLCGRAAAVSPVADGPNLAVASIAVRSRALRERANQSCARARAARARAQAAFERSRERRIIVRDKMIARALQPAQI